MSSINMILSRNMTNYYEQIYFILLLCFISATIGIQDNKKQIFSQTNIVNCMAECLRLYSHFDVMLFTQDQILTINLNDNICDNSITISFFCECLDNVTLSEENSFSVLTTNESNNLTLYCRDAHQLTFKWIPSSDNFSVSFYILSLENNMSNSTIIITSTNETTYTFLNLISNTTYRITLWVFKNELQLYGDIETTTLEENGLVLPVEYIWTENLKLMQGNKSYEVDICWAPSEELTCSYEFLLVTPDFSISDRTVNQEHLYRVHMNGLKFGGNYTVAISAKASEDNDSDKLWVSFLVPTCLETKKNLKECPPDQPEDLQIIESDCKHSGIQNKMCMFDVFIKWKKPEMQPDNYTLEIKIDNKNDSSNVISFIEHISGNNTNFTFKNVSLRAIYEIKVTAFSEGGKSPFASEIRTIPKDLFSNYIEHEPYVNKTINEFFIIISSLLVIFIIIGITVYCYKKKRKRNPRDQKYFKELEKSNEVLSICEVKNKCYTDDIFEIPQSHLILHTLLGQGAFGVVRRGFLIPKQQDVAVKMLKDDATMEDIQQFKQEIEMMKSIESHPNLVSMIGYCMADTSDHKIYLIVEYCSLGDLQKYLRFFWNQLQTKCTTINKNDPCINRYYNICNNVFNLSYGTDIENSKCETKESVLTPVDLLSFSRQIALGMEYLSNNRIVHRDLAARNVLVTDNRTMKIADFGLSRDIYQENLYKKMGNGKLPIKWMALESLTHQLYTTQSDVWSFGILLWEIVTLGSSPYPSIPTSRLLKLLQSGYRMERPTNCSSELYSLMLSCWNVCPKERPIFEVLRSSLEVLLEAATPDKYLSLDTLEYKDDYQNESSDSLRSSEESQNMYLKPRRCDL